MVKKKILYVITKSVWGGAQRYVYDLATNLPKDNFDVAVITGGEGALVEKLHKAGIRTISLKILQEKGGIFSVLFSLVNIRLLFLLIKLFRDERPDIIHLNSSKVGGLGAIAAFFYKLYSRITSNQLPVTIFTVHGWPFKEDRPLPAQLLILFLSWLSTLLHDRVILINTGDLKSAEKFVPREKRVLIFNGIEEISFLSRQEARSFFSQKIGNDIPENAILIGVSAELTRNKGLPYLIEALHLLKTKGAMQNVYTAVISDGADKEKLEKQIVARGLEKEIFLLGFIPNAKRYLTGFDLFVLPSLKEGLPYTILEAMAAGLPVVATSVGGIPDLIHHNESGFLVPPKDPTRLADELAKLVKNGDERARLGQNARKTLDTQFGIHDMVADTIKIYL